MRLMIFAGLFGYLLVAGHSANAVIICDQQGCRETGARGSAPASSATSVRSFSGNDVYKAVQCDVGRLAKTMNAEKIVLPAEKKFVKFNYTATDITEYKGGLIVGFPNLFGWLSGPSVSTEGGNKSTLKDRGGATINLHPDNAQACARRNIIPVRVYECLASKTFLIQGDGAGCSTEVTGYGKLNASGKVTVWVFNIGPSAEYNATKTFNIETSAPPPPR